VRKKGRFAEKIMAFRKAPRLLEQSKRGRGDQVGRIVKRRVRWTDKHLKGRKEGNVATHCEIGKSELSVRRKDRKRNKLRPEKK